MKTYHYYVVNSLTKKVILSSSFRQDFSGYEHEGKAHLCGLASKLDNNLNDFHKVEVLPAIKNNRKRRVIRVVRKITASSNINRVGLCISFLININQHNS